jgi:hypothetical protein
VAAQQVQNRLGGLVLIAVAVVCVGLNAFSHFELIRPG